MIVRAGGERIRVDFKTGSVSELVRRLAFSREEVLVKVNGKLVPEDAEITSKDKVEVIKVVFGG